MTNALRVDREDNHGIKQAISKHHLDQNGLRVIYREGCVTQ